MFSDDIVFESTTPELGTVIIKGMTAFKALVDDRYIKPEKTSKAVCRDIQAIVMSSDRRSHGKGAYLGELDHYGIVAPVVLDGPINGRVFVA